jgi:hypothetical protein
MTVNLSCTKWNVPCEFLCSDIIIIRNQAGWYSGNVVRWCIQKFPDAVDNEITLTTINTRWEATQSVMAAKITRLAHKIARQLHLVAESCIICSSRSRRPVRILSDTPLYIQSCIQKVSGSKCGWVNGYLIEHCRGYPVHISAGMLWWSRSRGPSSSSLRTYIVINFPCV